MSLMTSLTMKMRSFITAHRSIGERSWTLSRPSVPLLLSSGMKQKRLNFRFKWLLKTDLIEGTEALNVYLLNFSLHFLNLFEMTWSFRERNLKTKNTTSAWKLCFWENSSVHLDLMLIRVMWIVTQWRQSAWQL